MLFKLSNLNSNLALTLGYLNPALNNSAQVSTTQGENWYVFQFKIPASQILSSKFPQQIWQKANLSHLHQLVSLLRCFEIMATVKWRLEIFTLLYWTNFRVAYTRLLALVSDKRLQHSGWEPSPFNRVGQVSSLIPWRNLDARQTF